MRFLRYDTGMGKRPTGMVTPRIVLAVQLLAFVVVSVIAVVPAGAQSPLTWPLPVVTPAQFEPVGGAGKVNRQQAHGF